MLAYNSKNFNLKDLNSPIFDSLEFLSCINIDKYVPAVIKNGNRIFYYI